MSSIQLPNTLVDQIAAAGVPIGSVAEFVEQAVREKLAAEERRKEFFRLSGQMRAAMEKKGLTEEQLLTEFDALRHSS